MTSKALSIRVDAPGKAILMGEHAAVYGRPALVAAVDRRMHLRLAPDPDDGGISGLRLELPQLGIDERCSWSDLRTYGAERRDLWQSWQEAGAGEGFEIVLGEDPAHLVKVAVAETLSFLGESGAWQEPDGGLHLHMVSDLPVGSGFGSSAAASVAVVQAFLSLAGADLPQSELHRISLEVERRQHGSPSGVDNATVIYGGVLWVWRDGERLVMEPVELRNHELLSKLRIFHSGPPAEATGQVVAAVRRRREQDPETFDQDLDAACEHVHSLRRLLTLERCDDDDVLAALKGFGHWLEAQGAVPKAVQDLIRRVEASGGAAKISGAGSLTGDGAGSLLMFHPEPEKLEALLAGVDLDLTPMDLRLGAPGARIHVEPSSEFRVS